MNNRIAGKILTTQDGHCFKITSAKIIFDSIPTDLWIDGCDSYINSPSYAYVGFKASSRLVAVKTNPPGANPYNPELPWFDTDQLKEIFKNYNLVLNYRGGSKTLYKELGFTDKEDIKKLISNLTIKQFDKSSRSSDHPNEDADIYKVANWMSQITKTNSELQKYTSRGRRYLYLKFFVNHATQAVCILSFHTTKGSKKRFGGLFK